MSSSLNSSLHTTEDKKITYNYICSGDLAIHFEQSMKKAFSILIFLAAHFTYSNLLSKFCQKKLSGHHDDSSS